MRVGVYALAVTTAVSFLVGLLITLSGNARLIDLGEYQPWIPLIALKYGFLAGIVIGVVVGLITCLEYLRRSSPE